MKYIGARYIPVYSTWNNGVWDQTHQYEQLEVVINNGNYYISGTIVPPGVDITNTKYWHYNGSFNPDLADINKKYNDMLNRVTSVKDYGATGDGATNDTAAIKAAIAASKGIVLFPPGTYLINETLEMPQSTHVSFYLNNATIKQTSALNPMILLGSDDAGNYPQAIDGIGTLDMDNLGGVGIIISDYAGYANVRNLQIRGCSNGVGLQVGQNADSPVSLQAHFENVNIYGRDSRMPGKGMVLNALDCTFDAIYVYLCKTAIEVNRGGHYFGSLKIWGHTYTSYTDKEFADVVGINIISGSLTCGFLYLDSLGKGFVTNGYDQNISNLYVTSDITQKFTTAIVAHVFDTLRTEHIKVDQAFIYTPRTYTLKVFYTNNNQSAANTVINRRQLIAHQISDNTGFEIRDEAFNTSIQDITKEIVSSSTAEPNKYYLLGYIKNAAGIINLKISLKAALYFQVTMRVASGNTPSIVESKLIYPDNNVTNRHLYYGSAVSYDGIEWIPIYFKFDISTNYAELSVTSEVTAETSFYANIRRNYESLPFISESTGLTEIPMNKA